MRYLKAGSSVVLSAWALVLPLSASGQLFTSSQQLANPGAETGNLNGWTQVGAVGYIADNGSYDTGYNPHTGSFDFVAGANAGVSGSLQQSVDLTTVSGLDLAQVDAGHASAVVGFWENSYDQGSSSDYAHVQLTYKNGVGTTLGTSTTPDQMSINLWSSYSGTFSIPAGTRTILYSIDSFRANNGGSFIDAFTDDHSLTISVVPEPVSAGLATGLALAGLAAWRRWKTLS